MKNYFGKEGSDLIYRGNPRCRTLADGGGYVTASLCQEGEHFMVDVNTQEWGEYHLPEYFIVRRELTVCTLQA